MDIPQIAEASNLFATPLPRIQGTINFAALSKPPPSECVPSRSHGSEASGSVNSQVLYIKEHGKSRRGALSFVNNGSTHTDDVQVNTNVQDNPVEKAAWNIVDQEIFEWQYACRTGRPYWWSPQSKCTGLKNLPPRQLNEPSPQIWMRDIIDERWKPSYVHQRRAVSEGFLKDPTSDDLAHLVAIQLLGSCFTLPPDHIIGAPSPNYATLGVEDVTFPDPRMISSLRMHSHFRYSLCHGHQARNVSPIPMWSGAFDGSSPVALIPSPSITNRQHGDDPGAQLKHQRQFRNRFTASSNHKNSQDSGTESNETDVAIAGLPWEFPVPERSQSVLDFDFDRPRPTQESLKSQYTFPGNETTEIEETIQAHQTDMTQSLTTGHHLHAVIRSEPHYIFVQPVKELVVKRWKSLRRRIGSSLGRRESLDGSESGFSSHPSPVLSANGRERRRRAQQESEIDGSMNYLPHVNSPVSGQISPRIGSPEMPWMDSADDTPHFQLADPLVAAAELVAAQAKSFNPKLEKISFSLPEPAFNSETRISSTGITLSGNVPQLKPSPHSSPILKHRAHSATHSHSTRRGIRCRRKSTLSEVCIPNDFLTGS